MRTITVLGSTGSIGQQTVSLAKTWDVEVVGLTCGRNIEVFAEQIKTLRPRVAAVADEALLPALKERLGVTSTELLGGAEGVCAVASQGVDWTMAAITGAEGIEPTLAAESSRVLALANKEALVIAGVHLKQKTHEFGCQLLPVDSEHSAVFQVLEDKYPHQIDKIILTASGGPFLKTPLEKLKAVTPAEAIAHPNWSMGRKISVDSATLINKMLELIEAYYLFGLTPAHYDVWIHPQSIVHSFVSYVDGVLLAQLGLPSMLPPISYAFSWPQRNPLPHLACSLPDMGPLSFEKVEVDRFPIFALREAILDGGSCAHIAFALAAEQGVMAFLEGRLGFMDIVKVVQCVMEKKETLGFSNDHLSQSMGQVRAYGGEITRLSHHYIAHYAP